MVAAQPPAFTLSTPTGHHVVGTTRFVIDATSVRPLAVTAWYPAAGDAARLPTPSQVASRIHYNAIDLVPNGTLQVTCTTAIKLLSKRETLWMTCPSKLKQG